MIPLSVSLATLCVVINSVFVNGAAPVIDPSYATLYVLEYRTLNMTCTSVGSNTLVWEKGATRASNLGFRETQRMDVDSSGASTITFTISKAAASESDSGQYSCKSDDPTPRTIEVKVVTVKTVNADYNKTMETATLACTLTNVDASLYTMNWEFDGNKLVKNEKYSFIKENGTLIITDPGHKDGGEYTCVYNFSNQILRVPVNFYAVPIVKKFDKSKNLIQGDPLNIRCEVYGHPPSTVSWLKDGVPVEGMPRIELKEVDGVIGAKLEIKVVEFEDKGNYTCVANNTYFNTAASGSIVVRVKDKLAALWPFLGIVAEVIVLCVIIFIYEKKRSRSEEAEDAADAGNCANAADHKAKEEVRQRNVRT